MDIIKILVVEDNLLEVEKMSFCLEELGYQDFSVAQSIRDARDRLRDQLPDLLIMDIHLKSEIDGIEFVEEVRQHFPIPVIYVTSLQDPETLKRAQMTLPQAYLIKPVNYTNMTKLQSAIELSLFRFARAQTASGPDSEVFNWKEDMMIGESFFVKVGDQLRKVSTASIEYFQVASEKYCDLFTEGHKFSMRTSLSALISRLPGVHFVRVHRTYIINLKYLISINERDHTLRVGDHEIPIGKTYRGELMKRINYLR